MNTFLRSSLAVIVLVIAANSVQAQSVTVKLTGVIEAVGNIYASICLPQGFLQDYTNCEQSIIARAREGDMSIVFSQIPAGSYAIMIYHDENGNQVLDFETPSQPLEGTGLSNVSALSSSTPTFMDSSFTVDKDISLTIPMLYP